MSTLLISITAATGPRTSTTAQRFAAEACAQMRATDAGRERVAELLPRHLKSPRRLAGTTRRSLVLGWLAPRGGLPRLRDDPVAYRKETDVI